jgi:hypothetical protein
MRFGFSYYETSVKVLIGDVSGDHGMSAVSVAPGTALEFQLWLLIQLPEALPLAKLVQVRVAACSGWIASMIASAIRTWKEMLVKLHCLHNWFLRDCNFS